MMKHIIFAALAMIFVSGCMGRSRFMPRGTTTVAPYRSAAYAPGYGSVGGSAMSAPAMMGPPGMFLSEHTGTSFDPRTHAAIVQAELARESARSSAMIPAPIAPRTTGTPAVAGETSSDLDIVMDQVDAQGRELDALRREVRERR